MKTRLVLRIEGIVQGVGFRPFLYQLAQSRGLTGFVLNDDQGVLLEVEGDDAALDRFEDAIYAEAPPLARIDRVTPTRLPAAGHRGFEIRESPKAKLRRVPISPDAATCQDCLDEVLDPKDRRYRYPFTNCTHCGPRLTIVKDVPYDRTRTTMASFELCPTCRKEYEDPSDRRFHAQPNACFDCGPRLRLEDATGIRLPTLDPIAETRKLLTAGHIVAIKGLGGFHLSCDGQNEVAVHTLRERKVREEKPFALMAAGIEEIEKHCFVESSERELLQSTECPIVLLRRRPECALPEGIAPRQAYLGFMLPYSPHYHLLFCPMPGEPPAPRVLVMTSGNLSEEPIAFRDAEGHDRLQEIADYFLMHDREIQLRCDDSVARVFRGKPVIVRRARGYVPRAVDLYPDLPESVLAVGGMFKNTFALGRGSEAVVSHHIGDLENLETYRSLEEGVVHYCRLFDHDPDLIAHDLHPDYLSTRYAIEKPSRRRIAVQHHEAHIAAVLSEHACDRPAVGVAFDGTGFGRDGTLWGGEYFLFKDGRFERCGSLEPFLLPGGEAAIREPWRAAYSLLHAWMPGRDPLEWMRALSAKIPRPRSELVARMLEHRLNCPWTSGAGRYFDAVGSLLLSKSENLYEGQTPMELEMFAVRGMGDGASIDPWPVEIQETPSTTRIAVSGEPSWPSHFRIGLREALAQIVQGGTGSDRDARLAARFHRTMAEAVVCGAMRTAEVGHTRLVALGGGVFQNQLLLEMVCDGLEEKGLTPLLPSILPPNDGGLSYGQLAAVAWQLRA